MRRLKVVLLVGALSAATMFAGCSGQPTPPTTTPPSTTAPPSTTTTTEDSNTGTSGDDPIPGNCIIRFVTPAEPGGAAERQIVNIRNAKVILVLAPGEPIPDIDPELCD